MTKKHPILGFTETEDGTRIDTAVLKLFADVERRKFERALDTELDDGVRDMVEKVVAAFTALDAMIHTVTELAGHLEEEKRRLTPQPIIRTRIVDRDDLGRIVASEDRDEVPGMREARRGTQRRRGLRVRYTRTSAPLRTGSRARAR